VGDAAGKHASVSKITNGEISIYTVRDGDTLSEIAEMFEVSSKTILWANDLTNANQIHPGDSLIILPITGVRHVVKDGDTIQSIAKKYDGDVDDILAYNQLASASDISVGDTIVIPDGTIAATASAKAATAQKSSGGTKVSSGNGIYTNPLPGSIKTQGIHGYNGVDLAAPAGTPILAAAGGTVIVARNNGAWNGGYGNYVVIKHSNGTQTLYAHMSRVAAAEGDTVSQGEVIGYVGSTGRSTGNHLHFEVRGAVNPF
jgi:murein DD-endopeptidase MepM/ murein hydrolase activator NlpD